MIRQILTICGLFLLLMILPGCRDAGNGDEPARTLDTAVETADSSLLTPASALSPTPPGETAVPTPTPPTIEQLILWTSAEFAPRSELPGGQLLSEQLLAFDQNHSELNLEVQPKALAGQGGTLSYLRTGRTIAPVILPDLILLSSDQLMTATNDRLIYPLEQFISQEMRDDLYPATYELVQIDGHLMAYPFAVTGLQHLAYDPAVITGTLPLTWNDLIQVEEARLLFPANGFEGAELVLHLYLAAGGSLTNEAGQPDLQIEPLTAALSQIGRGRGSGLILLQSSNVATTAEAWQLFQAGAASLVQTRSTVFLGQEGLANNWGYAPLPGIDQTAVPLLKSWVWAVSTPDPVRQAQAVELLTWLTEPTNLGPWSASSHILPARRSALENWTAPPDYLHFIDSELMRAQAYPQAVTNTILAALSEAVFDVVTLATSPQVAAAAAAEAVRQ